MNRAMLALAALSFAACNADRATSADLDRNASATLSDGAQAGALYTLTNSAAGNEVLAFGRGADGSLTSLGAFAAGGNGSGSGLGSQGAVVLDIPARRLFAVNAGSNTIASFAVRRNGTLELIGTVPSGGTLPISLTLYGDLLYVLNGGGDGNITGFRGARSGHLTPIAGSTRPLSGSGVGPAQVQFEPAGDFVVVTEKMTNLIDVYGVDRHGVAGPPTSYPSAGQTPFGFAFAKRGVMIVSEAFGGAPDASAVSSYSVGLTTPLSAISPSVPTTETAACWIVVTGSARYTYTSNTGSGSITGYSIAADGSLTILDADGRTGITGAGSTPIDLALSRDSRYLYSTNTGNGTISAFLVRADGSLESIAGATGLPTGIVGLAAR